MQDKKLVINKEKCIGCGLCVAIAGGTFEFDEDGKARVRDEMSEDATTIQEAIDSCPVDAISWS